MKPIIPIPGEDLLELGKRCNAVYVCPKVGSVRKGPLVAYAGKDAQGRNFVGDIYFNFLKIAEEQPLVVTAFAAVALRKLVEQGFLDSFDTICGIPRGGKFFGEELARITGKRFTFPTKTEKPTEAGKKQEYTWDLSQFDFEPGERVAIVEDVCNNFKNTDQTLAEIAVAGVDVVLLVTALNRSPIYDSTYIPTSGPLFGYEIPVVASIRQAFPEYEQDDPAVLADIAAGNIEWEVKKNWSRLVAAMQQ